MFLPMHDDLIKRIEAFTKAAGMKESTFGLYAVHNGRLMERLRAGKDINTGTLRKIEAYIEARGAAEREATP